MTRLVAGLDIGVTSIGYGVIDIDSGEFVDYGVRLFEEGRTENNEKRRSARGRRRLLRRRKTRLYDLKLREKEEQEGTERRSKIGTGDRSEKIRTYNYPQNRVTDHRIGFTINTLDRVMQGDLDKIIEALITEDQNRKLRGE